MPFRFPVWALSLQTLVFERRNKFLKIQVKFISNKIPTSPTENKTVSTEYLNKDVTVSLIQSDWQVISGKFSTETLQ